MFENRVIPSCSSIRHVPETLPPAHRFSPTFHAKRGLAKRRYLLQWVLYRRSIAPRGSSRTPPDTPCNHLVRLARGAGCTCRSNKEQDLHPIVCIILPAHTSHARPSEGRRGIDGENVSASECAFSISCGAEFRNAAERRETVFVLKIEKTESSSLRETYATTRESVQLRRL